MRNVYFPQKSFWKLIFVVVLILCMYFSALEYGKVDIKADMHAILKAQPLFFGSLANDRKILYCYIVMLQVASWRHYSLM